MKKLKALKKISVFLLSISMLFGYVSPVLAANDDANTEENDTTEEITDTDDTNETTNDDNEDSETEEDSAAEAQNAVDVDFSTLEIGDQFKDYEGITYTVDDLSANIYVGTGDNRKLYPSGSSEIPNFEITYTKDDVTTWRKYVKLVDLCSITKNDGKHICEIMDATDMKNGEFYLKRIYAQKIEESVYDEDNKKGSSREISLYYKSYHNVGTKRFDAILQLVNGESEDDDDIIDTYTYSADDITSTEGKWSEEDDTSVLSTDIETLIDNNGVVYVSLRFVSESLGAEVKWVSEKDSEDGTDDDVYIQFYDDKEYCKDIEYTFTNNGIETDPADVEKSLYMKETVMQNISLDGTYTYTDDNGNNVSSNIDWKKVYILLTPATDYPEGFFDDNLALRNRILWIDEGEDNYLWVKSYVYGKYNSGTCGTDEITYNCDLGEDVTITGIILYKGVPIPIDLFNINDEKCTNTSND